MLLRVSEALFLFAEEALFVTFLLTELAFLVRADFAEFANLLTFDAIDPRGICDSSVLNS